ncbi:hypothetical protein TWF718_004952 [Orbilia javanica]|uniref:Uncharacterized protein n=1 Tax=Orbilia javanica TaxID=47235 RepID=A0AAN8RQZ7_9PEZI
MFHTRKTRNIKDLPIYSSLKPEASQATKLVAEHANAKDTSGQKRKLEALGEDNEIESQSNPAKRVRRARELLSKLHTLNEKGPKALADMKNPPVTPQNKVLGDLKIWNYSPPKTTESDKAIRLLVEKRMSKDAPVPGPARTNQSHRLRSSLPCREEESKGRGDEAKEGEH